VFLVATSALAGTPPERSAVSLSAAAEKLATRGRIGLQGKHAGAPIYFRNIKIKPLDRAS
jgi:hypothetical protein